MLTIEEIREACTGTDPIHLGDPVLSHFPMHLQQTFYPLGFPVQIETNSEEVLSCAAESWQGFVKLFDTEPIRLRVGIRKGRSSECPPAPDCRVQQNLVCSIADAENFAVTDLARGFSSIWLTEAALAHPTSLKRRPSSASPLHIPRRFMRPVSSAMAVEFCSAATPAPARHLSRMPVPARAGPTSPTTPATLSTIVRIAWSSGNVIWLASVRPP